MTDTTPDEPDSPDGSSRSDGSVAPDSATSDDAVQAEPVADPDGEPIVERRSIRRNLAHMVSSQLVSWVLATMLAVVVPRYLAPETQGELQLALSLWIVAMIFMDFGTSRYLQLEIARRPQRGIALVGPMLVIQTVIWFIAIAAVIAYAVAVGGGGRLTILVVLVGLASLLTSWASLLGTAFIGMEKMSTTAAVLVVTRAVNAISVVVVLVLGGGLMGIVLVGIATAALGLVQITWYFRRVAPIRLVGWHADAGRS